MRTRRCRCGAYAEEEKGERMKKDAFAKKSEHFEGSNTTCVTAL